MPNPTIEILLVDDDEVDRMSVQRALAKSNMPHHVTTAVDGIEALQRLRDERLSPPYLVLLDLNMPRMDGLAFLAAMRADPLIANSVVFILTTSNADRDRTAAYQHHIAGYIVKSSTGVRSEHLIEMIQSYCQIVQLPLAADTP